MKSLIHVNEYYGEVEVDVEAKMIVGRVLNIKDVVVFQGETVPEAEASFEHAIRDYELYCAQKGLPVERPFSGNIPFRTEPAIHRNVYLASRLANLSMNEWMERILSAASEGVLNVHGELSAGVPGNRREISTDFKVKLTKSARIEQ